MACPREGYKTIDQIVQRGLDIVSNYILNAMGGNADHVRTFGEEKNQGQSCATLCWCFCRVGSRTNFDKEKELATNAGK